MTLKTLVMTGRSPVRIDTDAWPRIAHSRGSCGEYGPGMTPRPECEYSRWGMTVRQHADGRVIVTAWADGSGEVWGRPLPSGCCDGGELLPPGSDIPAAIRRVGEDCGVPEAQIRATIADLPAEDLP